MSIVEANEFSVVLSEVPDPDPLPKQQYIATITDKKLYVSESGKSTISFTYKIAPSEYPVDFDPENAPDGVVLTGYYNVDCGVPPKPPTKTGLAKWRKVFERHGLPTDVSYHFEPITELNGTWGLPDDALAGFIGTEVKLTVTHDIWQGVTRAKVGQVDPIS